MVAVGLLGLLVMMLTSSLGSALKSSRQTKRFQQGSALGTEAVEEAKDIAYAALTNVTTDLVPATDPNLRTCTGWQTTRLIDPDGPAGPLRCERVESRPTGAINPHKQTRTVDGLQFTVWRYVTWIDLDNQGGPGQDLKRIVAVVEWDGGGVSRNYRISGTAVDARRGLEVPEFDIAPLEQGRRVVQGNQVVFAHTIRNLGVPDTYELQMSDGAEAPTRTWTYTFYEDVNANRELDGTDTQITTDADGDGLRETREVPTDSSLHLLVVWTLASDEAAGVESMQFVVRSVLDPEFSKSSKDYLEIATSPTPLLLHFHNGTEAPSAATNATPHLPMDEAAPTGTSPYPFSADVDPNQSGRVIQAGGSGPDETNPLEMANWVYQTPYRTPYDGLATLSLSLISPDSSCSSFTKSLHVYVQDKALADDAAGNVLVDLPFTVQSTPNPDATGACPTHSATLELPIDATVESGRWIDVKLIAVGTDLIVGYDTTDSDSTLTLPQTSVPVQVPA